jgi:hypothetical protein
VKISFRRIKREREKEKEKEGSNGNTIVLVLRFFLLKAFSCGRKKTRKGPIHRKMRKKSKCDELKSG